MNGKQREGGSKSAISAIAMETGDGAIRSQKLVCTTQSAHVIDIDSWEKVGLMMVAGYNCAYIFSYSSLIMVPLGWLWGIICLVLVGSFSYYANWTIARFQVIDGQRFIRYRDIMGYAFGSKMYYITYILQFSNLILANMGFLLLGGRALKEINEEFSDSPQRLQLFIVVNGIVCWIFSSAIPNMSAMGNWIGVSGFITATYVALTLPFLVKDGKSESTKDYSVPSNSGIVNFFNALGAVAAIATTSNSGLIPELQSTLRKPVVKNMRKALSMQFSLGLMVYYGMTILGYWAYGSSVSDYIPRGLGGPKWARVLINSLAFLQSVPSQHTFLAPVHEALDTKFLNLQESMNSKNNIFRRVLLRAMLLGMNTLLAAAFPLIGDFINLCGSLTLSPLTFLFPSMLFIKVGGKSSTMWLRALHWAIIAMICPFTILATTGAIRLIVHNTATYHIFGNT